MYTKDLFSAERTIYSVTELTQRVKENLETDFSGVWVEGEVSNVATPLSGHCYLTLKDKNASMRVVIFRYVNQSLRFKVENGLTVVCFGNLSVYAPRGEYQLVVTKAEPKGLGALQLAFEQLKKKLLAEGLFDKGHKQELPLLPRRIGIITSMTGAAIRDIMNVLERRHDNVSVVIAPVLVQGDGAAKEITDAIEMMNRYGDVDVIIIGRGGGSIEDLWAFNEEVVARAIFASGIPVISAVGHEVDVTISDFVADMRAPTPSAAAEMVVARKDYLEEKLELLRDSLRQLVVSKCDRYRMRLDTLANSYYFRNPRAIIERESITLDGMQEKLTTAAQARFEHEKAHFARICDTLQALSPLAVLSRGYGVTTRSDGSIVSSCATVAVGDQITTRVTDGQFRATVETIEPADS